ncbi:enoyl-CoA hydratase [Rummeliibacillus pycnus]|uniref:enoyl-CoA hydratase n=1 Tax=Rummeliibacillus pycnus TaxID=101070 RepID=UPI003D2C86BA
MGFETITVERNGRLVIVSLNRPQSMNAMDGVMLRELANCFEALQNESTIQLLILKGSGKVFSAGGDIKAMLGNDGEESFDIEEIMVDISRIVKSFYSLPMVTIAAVHGAAAGLGFSLALSSDIIIAEEDCKLAMNFIGIGLIPDGAGHFFMKERLSVPKAKQMIWAGEVLNGAAAKKIGLVDEVVENGTAIEQAGQLAQKLLHSPLAAMIETKKILHAQKQAELNNILEMEAETQIRMRKTADHLEGIRAFVEKRPANFEGK